MNMCPTQERDLLSFIKTKRQRGVVFLCVIHLLTEQREREGTLGRKMWENREESRVGSKVSKWKGRRRGGGVFAVSKIPDILF